MKIARGAIARAIDRPDPNIRFYLFHGSDEGQSRSHAQRLLAALGSTRFAISGAALKSDPALLADEASAMSLFGGPRLIWLEPAGEEIVEAVDSMLGAPAVESPVVAIAGALRKTSSLLKLAEASSLCLSYVSYVPEGQDAERMVGEVGRTLGLKVPGPVAARVATACSNDQAIVRRELEKLALYLDASTEAPKDLDHDALDEVGADLPEGDFARLADMAMAGRVRDVAGELAAMAGRGEAIPILRSLQRRILMLAPARARVENGESSAGVMASLDRSLYFKEKPLVSKLLQTWDAASLATLSERAGELERNIMLNGLPAGEGLAEELVAIARVAQRR